jgi:phospholipase/lecithinase/hemolysin
MLKKVAAGITALVILLSPLVADAGRPSGFSEIVVFGDSLSDTGNVFIITGPPPHGGLPGPLPPDPPYFMGRWSNGPVWVEKMASILGVPVPEPSLIGGTNYAWGTAETGEGLSFYGLPNIGMQIDSFLDGNQPREDQLFVVFGGANDFSVLEPADPAEVVANVVDHITKLADEGAKYFVVPNLPPLGKAPIALGSPEELLLDLLSIDFNIRSAVALRRLERELGITIIRPNVFAFYELMIAFPGFFGLENVTESAKLVPDDFWDDGVVDNPDDYLYFDFTHPTRVVHELMGELAAFQVKLRTRRFRGR